MSTASPSSTPARPASSSRSTRPPPTALCCSADRSRASAPRPRLADDEAAGTGRRRAELARRRLRPSTAPRAEILSNGGRELLGGRQVLGVRPSRRAWRHRITPRRCGSTRRSDREAREASCRWRRCTSRTIWRRSRRSWTRRPHLPQIACFDTAFHRSQPALAQAFALPRDSPQEGVRRYGFHGLSYEYHRHRNCARPRRTLRASTI